MSEIKVTAHLSDGIKADASLGKIVEVPVGPDIYTGDYTVTAPSDGNLVLPTKDKLMEDDVTIKANHEIEDALITNAEMNVYFNDRITNVETYRFFQTKIKKIILPNVTKIGRYSFYGNYLSELEEVYLPRCTSIGDNCFPRNDNLRILDLATFGSGQVNLCQSLTTLILRLPRIWNPASTSFVNCPFAKDGEGGYVYVPQSLLASYQASTAWANYAHVLEFRPIEGSEYELEE